MNKKVCIVGLGYIGLPTAALIAKTNNQVIGIVNNEINKRHYFMFFGVGSALFLIAHSIFLGIKFDYDLYKFFRRFVILGFIIFDSHNLKITRLLNKLGN